MSNDIVSPFGRQLVAQMTSPNDGWDFCLDLLDDVAPLLPGTEKGWMLRDLIQIEKRRREAYAALHPGEDVRLFVGRPRVVTDAPTDD